MFIIVNPSAGAGSALANWLRIEPKVRELVGPFTVLMTEDPALVKEHIAEKLRAGETEFIAAGGDGTVNLVMATIAEHASPAALETVKLGAIGLGSSNDFHKPVYAARYIDGVPCKLDFDSTIRHDVCLTTYRDTTGKLQRRRWFINASIGTTAEANHFFNNPNRPLRLLKRFSPWRGMVYAALRSAVGYGSPEMAITLDQNETVRTRVKNLGIVKNPHFTGLLRYDSPYEPNSGHFYVHLLRGVSMLRLTLTLLRLLRGKFSGQVGARSWRARRLTIQADEPFAVEGDGEVVTTKHALFSVTPGPLQVCT